MADVTSEVFYDFDIIVRKTGPGLYSVSMVAETGKKAAEEPFQGFESLADVSKALRKAKSADPGESPAMYGKLKAFGEKLFANMLSGNIGREVSRLNSVGGAVALRMRIEPDELRQVPWETLYDGTDFLAASSGVVISRIPPGTKKSDRPVVTEVPRMCCLMMRPFLEEYGDETRWEKCKKSWLAVLSKFQESGDFEMTVEEVVTLDGIRGVLAADNFEIIHIFCQSEDSQVLLAEGELIGVKALTKALASLANLRLLVLSSSYGNNVAIEQIGRELVTALIPGVLVMPFEMGVAQARAFLSTFYTAVAAGKRLDYATALGRRAILEIGEERADFMLPMFFMSLAQPFKPPTEKKPKPAVEPVGDRVSRLRQIIANEQGERKALALANLARIQQQGGELDLALENYGLATMLFEELKDKQNLAVALNNTATVLMRRGEFAKAVEPLKKCVELRKELGAKDETVIAQNKLGYSYRRTARLKKSVEMYRSSLDLNQQLQDRAGVTDSYFNLGITYEKMGELEAATEMFEKSTEEAIKLGDDARATDSLEYLAVICLDTENYSRARETCNRCLELREKIKDAAGRAITLGNLGSAELRADEFGSAKKHYEEALEIYRSKGKTAGVASCLHNLAFLQKKCGELPESVCLAVEARNLANKNSVGEVEFLSTALLEQIKNEVGPNKYAEFVSQAEERLAAKK